MNLQILKKKIVEIIEKQLSRDTNKAFADKSWDGSSWAKNKQGIVPSLVKTHKMKNSIKFNSKGTVIQAEAVGYAKYQNEGTITIPARQFMGEPSNLDNEVKKEIDVVMTNYMKEFLSKQFKTR